MFVFGCLKFKEIIGLHKLLPSHPSSCPHQTLAPPSMVKLYSRLSRVSGVNLHLRDLAGSQLIWPERKRESLVWQSHAFDSLFSYSNWSAVIKSSVSRYSLFGRVEWRAAAFCQNMWIIRDPGRRVPCQSDGKHSLSLLDSLKRCCKSWLPVGLCQANAGSCPQPRTLSGSFHYDRQVWGREGAKCWEWQRTNQRVLLQRMFVLCYGA
jgi:hypothetical protein